MNISESINEFRGNCKLSNPLKYKSFSRTKSAFHLFQFLSYGQRRVVLKFDTRYIISLLKVQK